MTSETPSPARPQPVGSRLVLTARARPVLTLAVLAGATLAVYVAVRTLWPGDRACITATCRAVVAAVRDGDRAALLDHVSPYFSEEGLDKQALSGMVERVLRQKPVDRAQVVVRQVELSGPQAGVRVHLTSVHAGRTARSEWFIRLEKADGRWLIRGATPLRVNGYRVAGLRSIVAMGY